MDLRDVLSLLSFLALKTVNVVMKNLLKTPAETTILTVSYNFYSIWSANENVSNVVNSSIKDSLNISFFLYLNLLQLIVIF